MFVCLFVFDKFSFRGGLFQESNWFFKCHCIQLFFLVYLCLRSKVFYFIFWSHLLHEIEFVHIGYFSRILGHKREDSLEWCRHRVHGTDDIIWSLCYMVLAQPLNTIICLIDFCDELLINYKTPFITRYS